MLGQWFIKTTAHHFKVAEGLFSPPKIYKYSLRVAKRTLDSSLQNPRPLHFPLRQGKLPGGEGREDTLKNNPESL